VSVDEGCNITIKLSRELADRLESLLQSEQLERDELVMQALHQYLTERQNRVLRQHLEQGYLEMAKINLDMACECFQIEQEADSVVVKIVKGVSQWK